MPTVDEIQKALMEKFLPMVEYETHKILEETGLTPDEYATKAIKYKFLGPIHLEEVWIDDRKYLETDVWVDGTEVKFKVRRFPGGVKSGGTNSDPYTMEEASNARG